MSGFLLDTNVISELRKPRPNAGLVDWLLSIRENDLYLSVITLGELRTGVELVVDQKKRDDLERWLLLEVVPRFEQRIVAFDAEVADCWGRVEARTRAGGRRMQVVDAMLAATAQRHALQIVTRNVEDFADGPAPVVNPWQ